MVITDLVQSRLDVAKKLIPSVKTVLLDKGSTDHEAAEKIKQAAGMDLKVAMECTGFESSVRGAIFVSHRHPIGRTAGHS